MTWVLVWKLLLRDLRLAWASRSPCCSSRFEAALWARITQPYHRRNPRRLPAAWASPPSTRSATFIFEGPGQVIQAIVGGADIRIESAEELMTVRHYVHPLTLTLLCLYAVGRFLASLIAGEIDRGTILELLLAQPLRRSQVIAAHLLVGTCSVLPPLCMHAVGSATWTRRSPVRRH